jgi:hypothetical protein
MLAAMWVTPHASAEPTPMQVSQQWSGTSRVSEGKPDAGVVVDQDAWAKVWQGIFPNKQVPTIDFSKQLVIVATSSGPNRLIGRLTIDEQGNVTGRFGATRMGGPGFGYAMFLVDRDGIKTYNGKPIPKPGPEKARPYVKVEIRGRLQAGVMAIGGETTGTTIRAGNIVFELDIPEPMKEKPAKLNNTMAHVEGELVLREGVEVAQRWIVKVTKLESAVPEDEQAAPAAESAKASQDESTPPRLSFAGLQKEQAKGVPVLGTLFRTRNGDQINFIPVEPRAEGVWSRSLTREVQQAALKRTQPQQHIPVIAFCDIQTKSTKPPADRPAHIRTGVYLGPIHVANLTKATFLTKDQATQMAEKLIEDETLRARFIARFR